MLGVMAICIGISGWRYARWRGTFYPAGLAQRRELEYAAGCFPSVEINGSFYSLQRPESFQRWHDETPEDFVFSVKGPRFITHMKRLRDCEQALANFFASGVLRLGAKLGPILWQLPPTLQFDAELLDAFLGSLPRDSEAALARARKRDTALMQGRSALAIDRRRPIRHALEVRHDSFCDPACMRLLRRHNVAVVVADTAGKFRIWRTSAQISSMCVCMAMRSCTPAATATPHWIAGQHASPRGPAEPNRTMQPASAHAPANAQCAMCTVISTTT